MGNEDIAINLVNVAMDRAEKAEAELREARAQIAELKARVEAKETTLMRIDAALATPARETK